MKKKGLLIIIPVIAVIGIMFFLGIKKYNESFNNFQYDGYVIDNTANATSSSYYFNKDAKYKVSPTRNMVSFDNSDNVEVSISDDSFLHFNDGSVSVFKKSVVLNLEELSQPVVHYYNIYNGTVFTKIGNTYQINYLSQKLVFNNFLVKVSDTKYMLVGNDITIQHGDKTERVTDGYVEFIYLDGNIVRLKNQSLEVQNISSDLTLKSGGIKLDMETKRLYADDTLKLNLGEITIDSDDNIEIVPDEINTTIDNPDLIDPVTGKAIEGSGNGNGGKGGSGSSEKPSVYTPNVNISGLRDGIIDTTLEKQEEIVVENVTVPDPTFTVSEFIVTQYGLLATVSITVPEMNVEIPSDSSIVTSIVDVKKNQVVYTQTNPGKDRVITVSGAVDKLNPNTNYAFVVHASYIKNDIGYEKDFIQKTFITESIGITLEKTYNKTDEFAVTVKRQDGSGISGFSYIVTDEEGNALPGRTEKSETLDNGSKTLYIDRGIESNTKYRVKILSLYNSETNTTLREQDFRDPIYIEVLTLKEDPTFASDSIVQVTNKQSNKFSFHLRNVSDVDNAVQEYRVDLYDTETGQLVASRSSNIAGTIDMLLDETVIQRGTAYRANIVVVVDDNDKVKEYEIGRTETFKMSGLKGPIATLTFQTITFEKAIGTLTIVDENQTLNPNSNLRITFTGTETFNAADGEENPYTQIVPLSQNQPDVNGVYTIPVGFNNLKANTYYMVTVMGDVDYRETSVPNYRSVCLATFNFNTNSTNSFRAVWPDSSDVHSANFAQYIKLVAGSDGDTTLEASTLTGLEIRFYKVDSYNPDLECNKENFCYRALLEDELKDQPEMSTLADTFYGDTADKKILITEKTFINNPKYKENNRDIADIITYGMYALELYQAYDYTRYQNNIPIEDSTLTVNASNGQNNDPIHGSEITPIYSDGTDGLKTTTIIGYKICPLLEAGVDVQGMNLTIAHDNKNFVINVPKANLDASNCYSIKFNDVPTADRNEVHYYRGGYFNFKYTLTYINSSGEQDVTDLQTSDEFLPNKQTPTAYGYIATRDANRITWGYEINDIDHAILSETNNSVTYYPIFFRTSSEASEVRAVCGANYNVVDCLSFDSNGSATGYVSTGDQEFTQYHEGNPALFVKIQLNEKASVAGDSTIKNMMLFEGWKVNKVASIDENNNNAPRYALHHVENRNYFNVLLISKGNDNYWHKDKTVVYKLTFTGKLPSGDSEQVVIYKTMNDVQPITIGANNYYGFKINHTDVQSLISLNDSDQERTITLDLELLYDTNYVGFENVSNNGFTLLKNYNGVTSYHYDEKGLYYSLADFSFTYNYISLDSMTQSKTINWTTSKGSKGVNHGDDAIMLSTLGSFELKSSQGGCRADSTINSTCSYSFLGDSPSFELPKTNMIKNIDGFKVKPVINSTERVEVYMFIERLNDSGLFENVKGCSVGNFQTNADSCSSAVFMSDNTDFINVTGLGHDEHYYRVIFKYKLNGSDRIRDFDYLDYKFGTNDVYGDWYDVDHSFPYYDVTTVNNPGFQSYRVKYDYGDNVSHDEYDRALKVSFNLNYTTGYDGIRFEVYKKTPNTVYTNEHGVRADGITAIKTVYVNSGLKETDNAVYINVTPTYGGHAGANPSPDNTMTTDNDYVVYAYPYYIEGGEEKTLSLSSIASADVEDFLLPKPFVNVKLIENASSSLINFYVSISDQKGSMGGYHAAYSTNPALTTAAESARTAEANADKRYFYDVYFIRNGVSEKVNSSHELMIAPQTGSLYEGLQCTSQDSCSVRVVFWTDRNNDGVYEQEYSTSEFNLSDGLSYSSVSASVLSTKTKIRVSFVDLYGTQNARQVTASLYSINSAGVPVIFKNLDMTPISFTQVGQISYFDLDFKTVIPNNTYFLQLELYDEDRNYTGSITLSVLVS